MSASLSTRILLYTLRLFLNLYERRLITSSIKEVSTDQADVSPHVQLNELYTLFSYSPVQVSEGLTSITGFCLYLVSGIIKGITPPVIDLKELSNANLAGLNSLFISLEIAGMYLLNYVITKNAPERLLPLCHYLFLSIRVVYTLCNWYCLAYLTIPIYRVYYAMYSVRLNPVYSFIKRSFNSLFVLLNLRSPDSK